MTRRANQREKRWGINMIAIIDYDAGNLKSVEKALRYLGKKSVVTREPEKIFAADKVILPGVGAFGDAMENLNRFGLVDVIRTFATGKKPFLGICLGLQLLFESSEECPGVEGLCLLPGRIRRLPAESGLKIPHMGWNSLEITDGKRLFRGIDQGAYVYFVHSYYLEASESSDVAAVTEYGACIHASVERGNLFACQFHPEKSGEIGLKILKNFAEMV